jgi:RHS repeat-associated protein
VNTRFLPQIVLAAAQVVIGGPAQAATPWSESTHQLSLADFNGDGRTDLLYVANDSWELSGIALSSGSGPTIDHQSWTSGFLGIQWHGSLYRPITADFNGDGRADLLLQRRTAGGSHYLLFTNAAGKLQSVSQQFVDGLDSQQWSADAHRIVAGDFNGDGKSDLFLQSELPSGTNSLFLAGAAGTFSTKKQTWPNEAFGFLWSVKNAWVHSGDFDGDGKSDLLVQSKPKTVLIDYDIPFPVPSFKANSFGILKAKVELNGEIFYPPPLQTWNHNALGMSWSPAHYDLLIEDFTGDGRADIFFQARSFGGMNRLLASNSGGQIGAGDLLQDTALRVVSGNQAKLHAANFGGGAAAGLYLQSRTPSGSNSYTSGVLTASSVGQSSHDLNAQTPAAPMVTDNSGRVDGAASVSETGEATYTIPLALPPGTNRMTPSLALTYGHRSGTGLLGAGWNLAGLSSISRCSRTFVQDGESRRITYIGSSRFCLDGNRLRLDTGTYGANGATYRTELESFVKVTSVGTTGCGPSSFTVHHKSGLIYEYGTNGQQAYGSGVQCSGANTVGEWPLSRILDRQGNRINFIYTFEGPTQRAYRLDSILYTENVSQGLVPSYKVQFVYENKPANEIDLNFLAGSQIKEIRRLDRIEVKYNNTLVRAYELTYEPGLSSAGQSRLQSVHLCSSTITNCLSPTNFVYQDGTPGLATEVSSGATMGSNDKHMALDISGDGRDDLIYQEGGQVKYRIALGSGGFSSPSNVNAPSEVGFPLDYNNDGRIDILTSIYLGATPYWHITLGSDSGFSGTLNTGVVAYDMSPSMFGLDARCADLNGDGWDDIVFSSVDNNGGVYFRVNYRNPAGSFHASTTLQTDGDPNGMNPSHLGLFIGDPTKRPMDFDGDGIADLLAEGLLNQWMFTSGGVGAPIYDYEVRSTARVGDVNGDGKGDVVWRSSAGVFGIGYGNGTDHFTNVSGPSSAGFYPNLELLDWNGDGKDDLLLYSPSTATSWLAYSNGETFLAPVNTGMIIGSRADFNGDGLDDTLLRSAGTLKYRLHQGVTPDRLATVTDGFGNSATFSYASLSNHSLYSKLSNAVFPLVDRSGSMSVVTNAQITNGAGGTYNLSGLSYVGAREHLQGRGFVGFESRSWIDSRDGTETVRTYRQDFPYTGLVRASKFAQSQGGTAIVEETVDHLAFSYSSGFNSRFFRYARQSIKKEYEVSGAYNGVLLRTITQTSTVDQATGENTEHLVATTEASGANGLDPNVTVTTRRYVPTLFTDWSTWCVGRPARIEESVERNSEHGARITRTSTTAWNSASCRPTQLVDEPDDNALLLTTAIGYDNFGNVNSTTLTGTGIAPRTESASFGPTGQFAESKTNALLQSETSTWNYAIGLPLSATDANGITINWQYDAFGRRTRENRPDGTYTTWQYVGCAPWCGTTGRAYVFQVTRESTGSELTSQTVLIDMLERRLGARSSTLGTSDSNGSLLMHWEYDGHGRQVRSSVPRLSQSASVHWNEYAYDLVGRRTQTSRRASDVDPTIQTTTLNHEGLTTRVVDPQGKNHYTKFGATGLVRKTIDHANYGQVFAYDAAGHVVTVTGNDGTPIQSATYNKRGVLVARTDMDLGSWGYSPNALGEVVSQTDAKGQTTQFSFDLLGRMISRTENEGTSNFVWGTSSAQRNIGRLASMSNSGYSESYAYDSLGRPSSTTIYADSTYQIDYTYDAHSGRMRWLTYPTSTSGCRLRVQFGYTRGEMTSITDASGAAQCGSTGQVYWTAKEGNGFNSISKELLGNGLTTQRYLDPVSGLLRSVTTGVGGGSSLQHLEYQWDLVGNLLSRKDLVQSGLEETFEYDNLHRLVESELDGDTNLSVTYDPRGNIASKTGIGQLNYHATKKHRLTSTANGWNFEYDANGNMTNGRGATLQWTSYNMPASIALGGLTSTFTYGPNRRYWKQEASFTDGIATTVYVGDVLEKVTTSLGTDFRHMIRAGGTTIVVSRLASGVNNTYYVTSEHLGSTSLITNSVGGLVVNTSYAAFGNRRGSAWSGAPTGGPGGEAEAIASTTRRGFTGHTMLDNIGLIHMNGRVYDPILGRFLSVDPFVTDPMNSQSFNRYSYVINNPLRFTDPSGFNYCVENPDAPPCVVVVTGTRENEPALRPLGVLRDRIGGDPCHGGYFDAEACLGRMLVPAFAAVDGDEVLVEPQGEHDYRANNLVCKRPLTKGEVKELIGRFTAPNEYNLLLGRAQGEGTHMVAFYGIPGGWVTTTFSHDGTIGTNTTTPFHVFTGTVDRWIDNTPDGAYMRTHGTGGYGVSNLQPGVNMSNYVAGLGPSVTVDWGRTLDNINQVMGPVIFDHVDSYVRDYVKDHFSGCL